uniref:CX domain-containing protein n=1 Tax=Rhabditophanes sp. KR3021 TaxID=114890 RepID=A0AC35TRR7_9BILA
MTYHSLFLPLIFIHSVFAVYQCPMQGSGGMSIYGGNYCGAESIFHHYSCCEDNYFECCFEIENWVVVIVVVVGLLLFCCCLGMALSILFAWKNVSKVVSTTIRKQ